MESNLQEKKTLTTKILCGSYKKIKENKDEGLKKLIKLLLRITYVVFRE